MTRQKFLAKLRRFCRSSGQTLLIEPARGKGSHARVTVDGKTTTVKSGELTPAYVQLLLKQLGLPREAID
ncbi:MAG: hypothetical protein U1E42_02545 [Rhodospirillales bacterium]